jgi:RNA polymerase sigma factor (sigma-70 family)
MPSPPDEPLPDPFDSPEEGPEDDQLVASMLAGDADALRVLIDRYDRLVRFTIFKAGRKYCDRDPGWLDVRANETWAGIVQALRRLGVRNIPDNLATYLIQIARNKSLDAIRQADSRRTLPFDSATAAESAAQTADPAEDPAAILENVEELDSLRDCISRLSSDDQVICAEIGLIVEKRWEEAAAALDMAESTLRSRWKAILGRLRMCLEKKTKNTPNRLAPRNDSTDS